MEKISEILKKRVKKAIKRSSLREVSRQSGVDVAILSRWISGVKQPAGETLDRLADWAGLTLTEIPKT